MLKIALPMIEDKVDGHFGHCQSFAIVTLDDEKKIVKQEKLVPPPGCGCKSNVVPQLAAMGVTTILAGNMGQGAVNKLNANGIAVVRGCAGSIKDVVEAWAKGQINDSGVGCSDHGHDGCHED